MAVRTAANSAAGRGMRGGWGLRLTGEGCWGGHPGCIYQTHYQGNLHRQISAPNTISPDAGMPVVLLGHVQELGKRVSVLGTEWGQVRVSKHGGWAIPCKILNPPPASLHFLASLDQPDSTPEHPDPGLPGGGVTEGPAGGKGRGIPGCHREDP